MVSLNLATFRSKQTLERSPLVAALYVGRDENPSPVAMLPATPYVRCIDMLWRWVSRYFDSDVAGRRVMVELVDLLCDPPFSAAVSNRFKLLLVRLRSQRAARLWGLQQAGNQFGLTVHSKAVPDAPPRMSRRAEASLSSSSSSSSSSSMSSSGSMINLSSPRGERSPRRRAASLLLAASSSSSGGGGAGSALKLSPRSNRLPRSPAPAPIQIAESSSEPRPSPRSSVTSLPLEDMDGIDGNATISGSRSGSRGSRVLRTSTSLKSLRSRIKRSGGSSTAKPSRSGDSGNGNGGGGGGKSVTPRGISSSARPKTRPKPSMSGSALSLSSTKSKRGTSSSSARKRSTRTSPRRAASFRHQRSPNAKSVEDLAGVQLGVDDKTSPSRGSRIRRSPSDNSGRQLRTQKSVTLLVAPQPVPKLTSLSIEAADDNVGEEKDTDDDDDDEITATEERDDCDDGDNDDGDDDDDLSTSSVSLDERAGHSSRRASRRHRRRRISSKHGGSVIAPPTPLSASDAKRDNNNNNDEAEDVSADRSARRRRKKRRSRRLSAKAGSDTDESIGGKMSPTRVVASASASSLSASSSSGSCSSSLSSVSASSSASSLVAVAAAVPSSHSPPASPRGASKPTPSSPRGSSPRGASSGAALRSDKDLIPSWEDAPIFEGSAADGSAASTQLCADYSTAALANALTLLHRWHFEQVTRTHLVRWVMSSAKQRARASPKLQPVACLVRLFNQMSLWVVAEILHQPTFRKRVAALQAFVSLAKRLLQMGNIDGSMAIVSGMSNSCIQRLKDTWAKLPVKYQNEYTRLDKLLDPQHNFRSYRTLLEKRLLAAAPVLPYVAIILRDLAFSFHGNRCFIDSANEVLNYELLLIVGRQLLMIDLFHASLGSLAISVPPADLSTALRRAIFESAWSEEDLYRLSLLCRPLADAATHSAASASPGSPPTSPTRTAKPIDVNEVLSIEPLAIESAAAYPQTVGFLDLVPDDDDDDDDDSLSTSSVAIDSASAYPTTKGFLDFIEGTNDTPLLSSSDYPGTKGFLDFIDSASDGEKEEKQGREEEEEENQEKAEDREDASHVVDKETSQNSDGNDDDGDDDDATDADEESMVARKQSDHVIDCSLSSSSSPPPPTTKSGSTIFFDSNSEMVVSWQFYFV
jgi:RasGEF domain